MSNIKDIRSACFRKQTLKNESFQTAKAGRKFVHNLWIVTLLLILVILLSIIPVFSAAVSELIISHALKLSYPLIFILFSFIIYPITLVLPIISGFEFITTCVITTLIIITTVFFIFLHHENKIWADALFLSLSILWNWLGVIVTAFSITISYAFVGVFGNITSILISAITAIFLPIIVKNTTSENEQFKNTIITVISLLIIFTGTTIAQQAMKGSPKFVWLKKIAIFLSATGGTSFYEADLTDACFDGAHLPHTDFRKANLTRTSFENVRGLESSRLQGTILENPKVRKLLIKKAGCEQDFTGLNLSGANLKNADLTKAYLNEVNALDADFSGATLTGACIQGLNINKNTRFIDVKCTHIFLKCTRDNDIIRLEERKPDSGEFKPGEFEKWIGEIQNTVDLIFRQGLNWRAFIFSLAQTAINHDGLDLSRYSITRKDETLVFAKIGVFPGANHSAIHQAFTSCYANTLNLIEANIPLVLQAKDGEIQRLRETIASNYQIIKELASVVAGTGRQVLIQGEGNRVYMLNQGEIMESKNEGINIGGNVGGNLDTGDKISAGGDMNLTASSLTGALNNVTNTIQQLSDVKTDSSDELAKILTILQKSIADDAALSDSQKQEALEAVETIAEEGKKPQEKRTPKFCKMALNALSGVTSAVTDASKLAEALKTYLPTLTKILGM